MLRTIWKCCWTCQGVMEVCRIVQFEKCCVLQNDFTKPNLTMALLIIASKGKVRKMLCHNHSLCTYKKKPISGGRSTRKIGTCDSFWSWLHTTVCLSQSSPSEAKSMTFKTVPIKIVKMLHSSTRREGFDLGSFWSRKFKNDSGTKMPDFNVSEHLSKRAEQAKKVLLHDNEGNPGYYKEFRN